MDDVDFGWILFEYAGLQAYWKKKIPSFVTVLI